MARFKLFLVGTPQPLTVDLPVSSLGDLNELASRARFITGNMAAPDHDGICCGVLIPTNRIQLVVESSE